jgi:hypothetical protein
MRIAFTLGLILTLAGLAPAARAGNEIGVVVTGESWMQPQLVAQIETWLGQHGHSQVPLPPEALEALKQCFASSNDLACARGVVDKLPRTSGVIYAGVDSKGAAGDVPDVTLTAYWFDKGHDAIAERKNCQHCTDQLLRTATDEILKKLVGGGDLGHLKLKSAPPGARISIDGQPIGVTPLDWDLPPGKHTIAIDKPGFKTASQERVVQSNKSDLVVMTLTADGSDTRDETSSTLPRWVPHAAAEVGGLAVVTGIALIVFSPTADPKQRYYTNTRPPGIGLAIGGAVVGVAGAYWLWFRSPRTTSAPVAAFTGDTGYVGWLGSF